MQADDVCRLLKAAVDLHADHASTALLRFGIDTLATGFWMAFVARPSTLSAKETFTYHQTSPNRQDAATVRKGYA